MIRSRLRWILTCTVFLVSFSQGLSAEEQILSFKSHVKVSRDGDLAVDETIRVRVEGKIIKRGLVRSLPIEYQRKQSFSTLFSSARPPRAAAASFRIKEINLDDKKAFGWYLDKRAFGSYLRFNDSFFSSNDSPVSTLSVAYQYTDKSGVTQQQSFSTEVSKYELDRGIYIDYLEGYQQQGWLGYVFGRIAHAHLFTLTDRQGLNIESVEKNGVSEPWFSREADGQLTLYIGQRHLLLEPGEYEYKIRYRYQSQSWREDKKDKVSWNVTGNGWPFKISNAAAIIEYPVAIAPEETNVQAFTGFRGRVGDDFEISHFNENSVGITATRTLFPQEGLTVDLAWPQGAVGKSIRLNSIARLIGYNKEVFVFFLCWFGLIGWYLRTWNKHGRDPKLKLAIPRYKAPGDESPAVMRFINNHAEYDSRVFSSALVSLASKGFLKISQEKQGGFILTKTKDYRVSDIAYDERKIFYTLFDERVEVDPSKKSHAKLLYTAQNKHQSYLSKRFKQDDYDVSNSGKRFFLGFLAFVMWFWSLLFSFRNLTFEFWGFVAFSGLVFICCTVANRLISSRTKLGAERAPQMEGFFQYLTMAETDELRSVHPLRKTPEVYQEYLPYAVALDIEDIWGEQFSDVLSSAVMVGLAETFGTTNPDFSEYFDDMNRQFTNHVDSTRAQVNRAKARSHARSSSGSSSSGGSSWGGSSSGGSSSGGSSGGGSGGGGGGGW